MQKRDAPSKKAKAEPERSKRAVTALDSDGDPELLEATNDSQEPRVERSSGTTKGGGRDSLGNAPTDYKSGDQDSLTEYLQIQKDLTRLRKRLALIKRTAQAQRDHNNLTKK